jgi:hypothetical protein
MFAVGDCGFPLPLTRHLVEFLTHRPTGSLVLARLVLVVRRDNTNENQALRKRAVERNVESTTLSVVR